MALPSEAVARYLQLLESDSYRDLAWANDLQQSMRNLGLVEAGRLIAPTLRPHFLSKSQFATLVRATERFLTIAEQIYRLALQSGPLLSRLRLLPAERVLAQLPTGGSGLSASAYAEAHLRHDKWRLSGFESATAPRMAKIDLLSEIFAKLPILRDLQLSGFPFRSACSSGRLYHAVLKTWKEFGGRNIPNIAVLHHNGGAPTEGQLIAELLSRRGADARVVCAESLEYADGRLRSRDFVVDVLFRSMTTRQLLLQIDLAHPLFEACRHQAVCVINNFRSEIVNRRSFFALLTDCQVTRTLSPGDLKLIRELARWTRVVAPGKTEFHGETVDLLEFVRKNRQQLALLPNDDSAGLPSFYGADMTVLAWERALVNALASVYVVQERPASDCESFPSYQHGNLEMQCAEATVHPHIFSGKVHSASAVLTCHRPGCSTPTAIAPILLLDS